MSSDLTRRRYAKRGEERLMTVAETLKVSMACGWLKGRMEITPETGGLFKERYQV